MDVPDGSPSSNVTVVEHAGKRIYIVGTAHISQRSVVEVEKLIGDVRPDAVCVELDKTRYEAMVDDSRWRKLDLFDIVKQKRAAFFLVSLTLTAYQRKLGEKIGIRPGAEMLAAVRKAEAVGAELVLADRDIQATLKRSFHNLSFWNKCQVMGVMIAAFLAKSDITEEQIEQLKDRDTIGEMMRVFAREMPELQVPLIDERDRYLMSSVQDAPGKTIVAVVGAGHVEGMVRYVGQAVDRGALSALPKPTRLARAVKWIIPSIVLACFAWGYRSGSLEGVERMLYAWVLPNSLAAALLSVIAGAKPLTVLTAALASPILSLAPFFGTGTVTGLVEAWLRRPTPEERERIQNDMMSLRTMRKNPFTRTLLVTFAATIGSALGAFIGAVWVMTLL